MFWHAVLCSIRGVVLIHGHFIDVRTSEIIDIDLVLNAPPVAEVMTAAVASVGGHGQC